MSSQYYSVISIHWLLKYLLAILASNTELNRTMYHNYLYCDDYVILYDNYNYIHMILILILHDHIMMV